MATFHLSAKLIKRSAGRSVIAAAAYRACEKIYDERQSLTHDYTKKGGLVFNEILIPTNAPAWSKDRARLWNEVEKAEKRKDAQLAREIEVALPREVSQENQIKLVKEFCKHNFVKHGMIADIAIHQVKSSDGLTNPHAHILLTTRSIDKKGFGQKERVWNDQELIETWRKDWEQKTNKVYAKEQKEERIDHRSYKRQGIATIYPPTRHLGAKRWELVKRGVKLWDQISKGIRKIAPDQSNKEALNKRQGGESLRNVWDWITKEKNEAWERYLAEQNVRKIEREQRQEKEKAERIARNAQLPRTIKPRDRGFER